MILTSFLCGLTVSLALTALRQDILETLMTEFAVPWMDSAPLSSVSEAAEGVFRTLRGEGTGYLEEHFPYLNPKEIIHLEDCADLVGSLRIFGISSVLSGILCVSAGLVFWRKALSRCAAAASAVFLLLLIGLACWACVNFDGLMIAFHRIFFTNDYWLLDPGRDVLIQFMPVPFFVSYGKIMALRSVLPVSVLAVGFLYIYHGFLSKGLIGENELF